MRQKKLFRRNWKTQTRIEGPHKLPQNWDWVNLEEVCEINKFSVNPTKEFPDEEFHYIEISSIENGTGSIKEVKILKGRDAPSRARRKIQENDILMSTVRPYLKAFSIVPSKYAGQICSTGFAVLTPREILYPKFLFYVLFSDAIINQCKKIMFGAHYPALSMAQVAKLLIPIPFEKSKPDIKEQKRIADRIEVLFNLIDMVSKHRFESRKMVKELNYSMLQHIFSIVEEDSWEIGLLKDFSRTDDDPVQTGPFGAQLHASDYVSEGVPLIRIKNILDGIIIKDDLVFIREEKAQELERYRLNPGDIVFSRVGTVGRAAAVNDEHAGWLISGQMLRIRLENPKIDSNFLAYIMASKWFQKALESKVVGSTRKSINTEILENLEISFPPLKKQKRIVVFLRNLMNIKTELLEFYRLMDDELQELRQIVLAEAFKGKL